MAAALLLLGFLTASGCRNIAVVAAKRERQHAERRCARGSPRHPRHGAHPRRPGDPQYERFRKDLAVAEAS